MMMRAASSVSLEASARSLVNSFRGALTGAPACLEEFVSASVDALTAGYRLPLVLMEIDAVSEEPLTKAERGARRDCLLSVQYTLDALAARGSDLPDARDAEIASFVAGVIDAQTPEMQIDRALAASHRKQLFLIDSEEKRRRREKNMVAPITQVVLLAMRSVYGRQADDSYPGATG